MGNVKSYLPSPPSFGRKRKRRESEYVEETEEDIERILRTPKRSRLMSTSQYIYKTLFEEENSSDVTIIMLDKVWKLHKVYLCQSPYFASMFGGSWKESFDSEISIEIADENITPDALRIVLGSLYRDDVLIEPAQVVAVLGAAVLFQMDTLIKQCEQIMMETISVHTAFSYYSASMSYGLDGPENACFAWFLGNILTLQHTAPQYLREASCDLMASLLRSPDIFMIQTEFSAYVLLKVWVFLRENPDWNVVAAAGSGECVMSAAQQFFKDRSAEADTPYLHSAPGCIYLVAFQSLRLASLVNHHVDVEMLDADRIIPPEWLYPVFKTQWIQMLRIDQGADRGPKNVTDEEFLRTCMRCGRTLFSEGQHTWRWVGFNFGLDLLVSYERRTLKFRRNAATPQETEASSPSARQSAGAAPRTIMYRLVVASISAKSNPGGQKLLYKRSTGIQTLQLKRNEEVTVLTLDKEATFPLLLSANFLVTSPSNICSAIEG